MAEVVLFHHALGQTGGFLSFAEALRQAGHRVHAPDLYAGQTFTDLTDGVAHAEQIGFDTVVALGTAAIEDLPPGLVYAGFSLGALPAQALAQTRPGARGALLFHGGVPAAEFGGSWPAGVPLQVHTMDADEWTDIGELTELTAQVPDAELFLYPGSGHLFADPATADYNPEAAGLLMQRTLDFLDRAG